MGAIQPWHILFVVVILAAVLVVTVFLVRSARRRVQKAQRPGWYPAQDDPTMERWFDGSTWTARTRPRGAA